MRYCGQSLLCTQIGYRRRHPLRDQAHRNSSGAFTKLSELKPSALRRTVSQQEGPQTPATSSDTPASESESESESDSETGSDSDSDSDQTSQPALPASKMAGASAAASAENASSAKRKRTFFSALS